MLIINSQIKQKFVTWTEQTVAVYKADFTTHLLDDEIVNQNEHRGRLKRMS